MLDSVFMLIHSTDLARSGLSSKKTPTCLTRGCLAVGRRKARLCSLELLNYFPGLNLYGKTYRFEIFKWMKGAKCSMISCKELNKWAHRIKENEGEMLSCTAVSWSTCSEGLSCLFVGSVSGRLCLGHSIILLKNCSQVVGRTQWEEWIY